MKTTTGLRLNIEAHAIAIAAFGPCKIENCSICAAEVKA